MALKRVPMRMKMRDPRGPMWVTHQPHPRASTIQRDTVYVIRGEAPLDIEANFSWDQREDSILSQAL